MTAASNRWAVLALLFLIGLTVPTQFQAVAALAPFITTQASLSHTDLGVLTGLFMFSGIFLAAPIGILAARIGDRLTLIAGLTVMAASAIAFASTVSYEIMFASRLVGGAGAVAVSVLMPKVATDWFGGKEIATAMATVAASFGFGIGLAMALLPSIAAATSWQTAALVNIAPIALAISLLFLVFQNQGSTGTKSSGERRLWSISDRELILASIAGIGRGLFSTGYVVFMGFLPLVLVAQGASTTEAALLTSIAAIVSLASVPLGGYLSDLTGKPNLFIIGGSVGTAMACFLVPYVAPAVLWIFLFGLVRGGCTGGVMALPSQVLNSESRSTGFAVVSAMYFVCMAAFPAFAGWITDEMGTAVAALWFAGFLWLAIILMLAVFKTLQHAWSTK
jgi:MFS family permease